MRYTLSAQKNIYYSIYTSKIPLGKFLHRNIQYSYSYMLGESLQHNKFIAYIKTHNLKAKHLGKIRKYEHELNGPKILL